MKKEIAYLLGFFYADGWLAQNKKYPTIELQENDGSYLFELAKKELLTNRFKKRKRNNSIIKQISFRITNKAHRKLFEDIISDKINMNNVKNYIEPEDYSYFLRGFFDGDGCINLQKFKSRVYFYGTKDQDWSFILNILDKLDIGYNHTINIRKDGKHQSSFICISSKYDCVKLFEYLYPDYIYDFGLFRKYEKLLLNKMSIKRKRPSGKRVNTFYTKRYDK